MAEASEFCSCDKLKCPHHPKNHNKGCTPCIEKNLRTKEIPNCIFNLADIEKKHTKDTFEDFAKFKLENNIKSSDN